MLETENTYLQANAVAAPNEHFPAIPGYRIEKLLGEGGMGKVFQAVDQRLHRTVALKLVSGMQDSVLARFKQEINAVASLRHPNITQIYESGVFEGRPWFSMELIPGGTLSDKLRNGPLPPRVAAGLIRTLALAMQYAHEQQILHRDLKPGNILLECENPEKWSPSISDFGLAKKLSDASKLTQTGEIFGSPSYMAPEQASGIGKLTPAIDIYALGAILYECISGRPPFLGADPVATVMMVISQEPVSLRKMQAKLSIDLNTICMKCLEKSPKKRYSSASELAADLERFLNDVPIHARPIGMLEKMTKWARRKPWQAVAAVLSLVLIVGLFIGLWMLQQAFYETKIANEKTNRALDLSLDTSGVILEKMTTILDAYPKAETHVRDAYATSIQMYQTLDELRPEDRRTTLKYANVLYEYAMLLGVYQKYDEANAIFAKTESFFKQKMERNPEDADLRLEQIRFLLNRAWISRQTSDLVTARKDEEEAAKLIEKARQQNPTDIRLMRQRNTILEATITDLTIQKAVPEIIELKREILANCEKIAELQPLIEHRQLSFAARRSLATYLHMTGRLAEVRSELFLMAKTLPDLNLDAQNKTSAELDFLIMLGDIERQEKIFDSAKVRFDQAVPLITQLRADYPQFLGYLYKEFDLRGKRIQLQADEGKLQDARKAMTQLVEDMGKTIARHPEYDSLASLRNYYRKLSEKLSQAEGN